MNKKLDITCVEHNKFFSQVAQAHLKGLNGCDDCNGQKKITPEEFVKRGEEIFGAGVFDYSALPSLLDNIHQKVSLTCNLHNFTFIQSAWSHINKKNGCLYCNKFGRVTEEKLITKAQEIYHDKKYDYSQIDYSLGVKEKVVIGCPEVGHGFFQQSLDGHFSGREGCPLCTQKKILTSKEDFIKKSRLIHGNKYDDSYDDVILLHGLQGKIELECNTHGKFSYSIFRHLQGLEGCVKCRKKKTSRAEKELSEYVKSITHHEVMTSERNVLKGKELDIYIPAMSLAIEFNGLYWHSEETGKDKWYHYDKWKKCHEKGIQLITIWEDDWEDNPSLVKKMISHKLGVNTSRRVPARKTYIKTVLDAEARVFYENNHIQGHHSGYHIGLYFNHDDSLVALSTWKKYSQSKEVRLERFATSCIVPGGFSKLLKNAISFFSEDFEKIVTFADHEVSDGGLYTQHGFTLEKELAPDYSYIYRGRRNHKFGFRIKRFKNDPTLLFEPYLSERELAQRNGLLRVWDYGKTKYSYTL